MNVEKIKLQTEQIDLTKLLVFVYLKNKIIKIEGNSDFCYQYLERYNKLPYVCHYCFVSKNTEFFSWMLNGVFFNEKGLLFSKNKDKEIRNGFFVHHPLVKLKVMPYSNYINRFVVGNSTLEYLVKCYGRRNKYILVQESRDSSYIHKLLCCFRKFPRSYIKELDLFF